MLTPPTWQPATPALSTADVPVALAEHQVVVLHYWAVWNNIDRQMDAALLTLRPRFEGQVAFYSFDTPPEEGWPLLREWNFLTLPALVCFVEGRKHGILNGMRAKQVIDEALQGWLS